MRVERYRNFLNSKQGDKAVALSLFLILTGIEGWLYHIGGADFNSFGAEYGEIATSIVNGNGFSNVFDEQSGPTAWHPPLTVIFYAIIFFIFGIQSVASIWVLLIFRNIFLSVALFFLLKTLVQTPFSRFRALIAVIFIFQILIVQLLNFIVEDVEIAIMLSSLMLYALHSFSLDKITNSLLIYILAFILPLTVPSFALSFAVILFLIFLKNFVRVWNDEKMSLRKFSEDFFSSGTFNRELPKWFTTTLIAGFIFVSSASVWSYRNYLVFNDFIPIKSNLWFEFYLANNPNADGLYSFSKLNLDHPYRNSEVTRDYMELGEIVFIENRKEKAQTYVKNNPDHYIRNTATRLRSAFVWTDMVKDVRDVNLDLFSENELKKINKTRLLLGSKWTSLNMTKEDFLLALQKLELQREKEIFNDWKNQRELYLETKYSITNITAGLILALVPVLLMIAGLFINTIRSSRVFKVTIGIYLIHLLPYLLISHWYRYQLFLLALQAILIFLIISFIIDTLLHPQALKN